MTEDKGKLDQLKGEAKDRIGGATGDKEKQAEGLKDKATGKAKEFAADVKDKAEELKDKWGKKE